VTYDLIFVGGGFRTTTLLASAPHLLDHRLAILERGQSVGPGGFGNYAITTTSIGSRFLKDVQFCGPFARLSRDHTVTTVATATQPVPMRELAGALSELGQTLCDTLGRDRVHLNSRVVAVDVRSAGPGVVAELGDGRRIAARFAVLATGRHERQHPSLAPWRAKTVLSSHIISARHRAGFKERLVSVGAQSIVIAGCSHSAMSALSVLLDLCAELQADKAGYMRPAITVLRRSGTRLMYDDTAQADAQQVPGRELIFDPLRDVCPVTGIVFRDSGLRHESRTLFCDLWAGNIDRAHLVDAPSLSDSAALLDSAGLVVQALGYHGNAPDILIDGNLARPADSSSRLLADEHGAAILQDRPHDALSVLRVEPTPADKRDNAAYGSGLSQRLATRLTRQLDSARQEADAQ